MASLVIRDSNEITKHPIWESKYPGSINHHVSSRLEDRDSANRRMSGSYASKSRSFAHQVLRQSFIALTWIPPVIFFENHVASIAIIDGISMKPTFNPESNLMRRDWVLENKWFMMQGKELERGDVVTLRSPLTNRMVTKRVVGIAGDIVSTRAPRAGRVVTIPLGHVWLVCSNRGM